MQSWNTKTDVFWCSWVSKTKWKYSRSMYFVYFIHSVQSMQCRVESFANCRGYLVGLLVTHCWVYTHPAKYLFFLWTLCQTIHRDWCPSFVTYKWKYSFYIMSNLPLMSTFWHVTRLKIPVLSVNNIPSWPYHLSRQCDTFFAKSKSNAHLIFTLTSKPTQPVFSSGCAILPRLFEYKVAQASSEVVTRSR